MSRTGSTRVGARRKYLIQTTFNGQKMTGALARNFVTHRTQVQFELLSVFGAAPVSSLSYSVNKINLLQMIMAEREGFEPPMPSQACRISSAVHSTTLPPLRNEP